MPQIKLTKDGVVEHPNHYTWHPIIECKDVIMEFPWALGEAIKYIWRAGRKGDAVEDLKKARQVLLYEIQRRMGDESAE